MPLGEWQAIPVWLAQACPKPFAHRVAIFEIPIFALGQVARLLPPLRVVADRNSVSLYHWSSWARIHEEG